MKLTHFAASAALSLLVLTSCSEDQSSFDIQNVPGRCLIEGVVKYNEGTTMENGHFAYSYKAAANLEITVTVNNSEYGALRGESVFTTVTDSEGKYSIEIPAPRNTINATITTADFRGTRTYITDENNKVVTKTQDVIFRGQSSASIHSEGIVYANFECNPHSVNSVISGFNQYAKIEGSVGRGIEYVVPAERLYNEDNELTGYRDARRYYVYDRCRADLIVRVNYQNETYIYNVTSGTDGEWTLQVPVKEFPADFTYDVMAMPYDSDYTHYVAEENTYVLPNDYYEIERTYTTFTGHTIKGYYSRKWTPRFDASFPVANQVCTSQAKVLVFEPFNTVEDTYGYSSSSFTSSNKWLSELIESLQQ